MYNAWAAEIIAVEPYSLNECFLFDIQIVKPIVVEKASDS